MLWKQKAHKGGNIERLTVGTGFGRGMAKLARSVNSGLRVKKTACYLVKSDKQIAKLIKGSEPFIDTAMEISAVGVSDRGMQQSWISAIGKTVQECLPFVDLLVIRLVKKASEEDLRHLHGLLYRRARAGKPTVVDEIDDLMQAIDFYDEVINLLDES